jgi:DNA-binding FrmR family transcriptional regulator
MTKSIETKLHDLTEAKQQALQYFEGLSTEQINSAPEGEWSMVQVIEHILMSEGGTLGYMMKKTSSGFDVLDRVGEQERLAENMLVKRLDSGERYKAPAVLPDPAGGASLEELSTKWEKLRGQLNAFISSVPEEYYDRLIFKQPAAGMITLNGTMDFLNSHLRHHFVQLERLRSQF